MATTSKNMFRGPFTPSPGTLDTIWVTRTANSGVGSWNYVAYSGSLFVALAASGTVTTSPDSIAWTERTTLALGSVGGLGYGNGMFVAVSGNNSNAAASSPDGITWTARTLPSTGGWSGVAHNGTVFVTLRFNSSAAATSTDGINWTARTLPSVATWNSVAWGNGLFVALCRDGTVGATSPDGITWTARTVPAGYWQVAFGNGMFVAFDRTNASSALAMSSPDGIAWTLRTLPTVTNWVGVAYGGGMWLIVSSNSFVSATSPDGITWSLRTMYSTTTGHASVVYGNGLFVVGGSNAFSTASTGVGQVTFYTAPALTTAVLTDIYASNSSSASLIWMNISGSNLLWQTTVPQNDKLVIATRQVLNPGDTIKGFTNSSSLTIHLNGVEIK